MRFELQRFPQHFRTLDKVQIIITCYILEVVFIWPLESSHYV